MNKRKYPKVVESFYCVLINGKPNKNFLKLKDARKMVKNIRIDDSIKEIKIVKQCTTHTTIDLFTPKTTKILTIDDFNWQGE